CPGCRGQLVVPSASSDPSPVPAEPDPLLRLDPPSSPRGLLANWRIAYGIGLAGLIAGLSILYFLPRLPFRKERNQGLAVSHLTGPENWQPQVLPAPELRPVMEDEVDVAAEALASLRAKRVSITSEQELRKQLLQVPELDLEAVAGTSQS